MAENKSGSSRRSFLKLLGFAPAAAVLPKIDLPKCATCGGHKSVIRRLPFELREDSLPGFRGSTAYSIPCPKCRPMDFENQNRILGVQAVAWQ